MVYTLPFFPLQNAVCFIILNSWVPVLFTYYIQDVLKLKNNSGSKMLKSSHLLRSYTPTYKLMTDQITTAVAIFSQLCSFPYHFTL